MLFNNHGYLHLISECYSFRCLQSIPECYSIIMDAHSSFQNAIHIDGLNPLSGFVLVFCSGKLIRRNSLELWWNMSQFTTKLQPSSPLTNNHPRLSQITILASHKFAPWLYFESWRIFLLVAKYKICDNLKQAILWWLKRCAEAEVHGSNLASPTIILESQRIIVYCVILRRKEIIGPFRL